MTESTAWKAGGSTPQSRVSSRDFRTPLLVFLQEHSCAPPRFVFAKSWFLASSHSLEAAEVLSCPEENMHRHEIRVIVPTSRWLALWGKTASRNLNSCLTFLQGAFVRVAAVRGGITRPMCQDDSAAPGAFGSCIWKGHLHDSQTVTMANTAAPLHVPSTSWDSTDKNTSVGCG